MDIDKAAKANVLELDNTTVFTPDADYEPATKKYVDDNETTVSVTDNLTSTSTTEALSANQGRALNVAKAAKADVLELDNTVTFTPDADYEPATKKYVDDNETTVTDNLTSTSTTEALSANQGRALNVAKAAKADVLELDNTTAFTPDADYEPATKKYVDDNETTVTVTDNLTSTSTTEALSANQGKVLDENKLNNTIADGTIFIGNGSGIAAAQNISGDATITNAGVVSISDNVITGENIALGSDTAGDLMYYNGTDWVSLNTGTAGQKLIVNSAATAPEWATEAASALTDLTDVNTATATAGNFLVADGTDFESVAMSGDATITDTGIVTISENAVDGTKIQVIGEAEGSMLYNDGTDWVDFPKGTSGQYLKMNSAGTAPEWVTEVSKRIGEFVFAKSGKTEANGYLAVSPGTIVNGATTYPLWASQYTEFVSGNDIVFPSDVAGMFMRNIGGNATTEGNFQDDATAQPNTAFTTNSTGAHTHSYGDYYYYDSGNQANYATGSGDDVGERREANRTTGSDGSHSHSVTGGGDTETRPINRAYQLYTIIDTY